MNPPPRTQAVAAILLFGSMATYFFLVPSLTHVGINGLAPLLPISLAVLLATCAHLLLSAIVTGQAPDRAVLMFALVPCAGLITSIIKGDFEGAGSNAFSILVLVAVSVCAGQSMRNVVEYGLVSLLVVSLILATFSDKFATVDRDFLPLIIDGRAFGILLHPNMLGLLAGLCTLIGVTFQRRGRLTITVIGIIGLLASASQTSILATAIGLAAILIARTFRRIGAAGGVAITLVAIIAIVIAYVLLDASERSTAASNSFDGTFTGRTRIWDFLLQQNFGMLGLTHAEFTSLLETQFGLGSAHNLYIEILTQSGYIGLIVLVLFMTWLIVRALVRRTDRLLAVTMTFVVTSLTEGVLLAMPLVAIFAVLLGDRTQPSVSIVTRDVPQSARSSTETTDSSLNPSPSHRHA